MQKNFSFGIKRLIGDVDATLKSWKSIGGEPTLPDVASKIDEWGQDVAALDNFDESITPSFQSAKSAINAAWNNRDNRKKAIESLSGVLKSLKSVPDEIKTFKAPLRRDVRSAKALFGDHASRYLVEPNIVFSELKELKTKVSGLASVYQRTDNIDMNIDAIKSQIGAIAYRYDARQPIHKNLSNAIKSIDFATKSVKLSDFKRQMANATSYLNVATNNANAMYSPDTYKANISTNNSANVVNAIKTLQKTLYSYHFYAPKDFLPEAIRQTKSVIKSLDRYDDYKAKRLAQATLDALMNSYRFANERSVKSLGDSGWAHQGVKDHFDFAMDNLSNLERHLDSVN